MPKLLPATLAILCKDEASKKKLRRRCQMDLWFLLTEIAYPDRTFESFHKDICDLFVQKDPDKAIEEQDTIKERLLLSPRGSYKTTIDEIDILQWIICFPDITILILSGTQDLAAKMVANIREQFIANPLLRILFPECCLPSTEKRERLTYTNPARKSLGIREATLELSTVESVKAGSHYWLIKADDPVHENNSKTLEQLQKAADAIDASRPLQNPGGYFDGIGTRYHVADAYARQLKFNKEMEDEGEGQVMKTLVLAAWTIKPDRAPVVNPDTGWAALKEDDVVLLFPSKLTFKKLYKEYRRNPGQFTCQYLNDPVASTQREFTRDELQRHTIPYTQLPQRSTVYIQWDLAGAVNYNRRNDDHVGVVAQVTTGGLYVVDIIKGKFGPHQIALQIVELARKWHPRMVYIENNKNEKFLESSLQAVAAQHNVSLPLEFIGASRHDHAKDHRIAYLHTLIAQDKFWILAGLPYLDDVYEQFTSWPNGEHDDLPDAMAQLAANTMIVGGLEVNVSLDDLAAQHDKYAQQAMYDRILNANDQPEPTPENPEPVKSGILGALGYGLRGN